MANNESRRAGWLQFIIANLDAIWMAIKWGVPASAVGVMTGWATWFTGLFSQYAPASWIFAGLAGVLLGAAIMALVAYTRVRFQIVRFRNGVFESTRFNPLETYFRNHRIRLVDLAPPVGAFIDGKTFIECDIVGPANVMFAGCTFQQNVGEVVDALVLRPGFLPRNGFGFRGCTFQRCRFFLLTFMVEENDYDLFVRTHQGLNWITEPAPPPAQASLLPAPKEIKNEQDTK